MDFNGRFRFVVLRPSGHVVSERAVKQVRTRHQSCRIFPRSSGLGANMTGSPLQWRPIQVPAAVEDHVGGRWDSMLPINGTQDEVDAMRQALLEERALQKVTH